MMSRPAILLALPALLSLMTGCINDDQARGHVVENEVVAGHLFVEAGTPAAGAVVSAVPVEYVPNKTLLKPGADTVVIRTYRTDAGGRYELKGLPKGQYNLIGSLDGTLSLQDSVVVDDGVDSIPADTLEAPGALTGVVELEPNHDPRAAFVQVLGTTRFVNTDSLGRFTLGDMAAGKYSLRILATYDGYTPLFQGVTVRAGRSDTLPQPLRLVFTGIPVVRGLSASFDTAAGTVRLEWNALRYPFLKDYLIFRKPTTQLDYPSQPIDQVTDTGYVDALDPALLENLQLMGNVALEYQVRARNLSNDRGAAFYVARVDVAPGTAVATTFAFRLAGLAGFEAGLGDTVRLVAEWQNPTRVQDSLYWRLEPDGPILRARALGGRQGTDTLRLVLPDKPGPVSIAAMARETGGSEWIGRATVNAILDAPVADAGPDFSVTIHDTIRLAGKGEDGLGRIVKYEWSIGPGNAFVDAEDGIATFVTGDVGKQTLVLRVTDDDGFTDTDSLVITSYDDLPKITVSSQTRLFADGGGYKLTASAQDRGRIVKWEWKIGAENPYVVGSRGDTSFFPTQPAGSTVVCMVRATDDDGHAIESGVEILVSKWSLVGKLPLGSPVMAGLGGKLYTLGGLASNSQSINDAYEVAPTTGASLPIKPAYENVAVVSGNGKLYTFGTGTNNYIKVFEYDPRLGEWELNQTTATEIERTGGGENRWSGFQAAFLEGKIYLAGNRFNHPWFSSSSSLTVLREIDPVRLEYRNLQPLPQPTRGSGMVGLDGRVYVIGGQVQQGNGAYVPSKLVLSYDVAAGSWSLKAPLPVALDRCAVVAVGGKIYTIGGTDGKSWKRVFQYDPAADSWQEKSPMLFDVADYSAAVIDGKIFAVDPAGNLQAYDPSTEP